MFKVLPLFIILLILAVSGCTIQTDPSPDAKASNSTTNHTNTKAKIAVTHTPKPTATPELIVIGHENSTVYVEIKGSEFNPSELRIMNGTIVKWQNMDDAFHAINGTNFNSPVLDKREVWAHTFNKTGTFEYGCNIHLWMKHGRIIVE